MQTGGEPLPALPIWNSLSPTRTTCSGRGVVPFAVKATVVVSLTVPRLAQRFAGASANPCTTSGNERCVRRVVASFPCIVEYSM